jgi:membrane protein implicated in regulation of membrane protease activity
MHARSIPEILTDLLGQTTTLLHKESQLARAELSEKVTQVAVALALLVTGAVLLIPALVILLQAGVSALITNGIIAEPWAPLIIGGVAFVIGLILALIGVSRLKADRLVPNRTIQQVHNDVSVVRQQTRDNHVQQRAA